MQLMKRDSLEVISTLGERGRPKRTWIETIANKFLAYLSDKIALDRINEFVRLIQPIPVRVDDNDDDDDYFLHACLVILSLVNNGFCVTNFNQSGMQLERG